MRKLPLIFTIIILFIIILAINIIFKTEQHFVLLAQSLLNGQLTITPPNNHISDLAYFEGKYFWPLGPFPAILLLPFVAIFHSFQQGFISAPLTLLNFYLLYKIARKLKLGIEKSYILAAFFIFGSIYTPLALIPASWHFAQVVATTLLILTIYEFLTKKRWLLIGFCSAFAVATRLNLIFASVFFLYFLTKKPISLTNIAKFTLPILLSLVLLGFYNNARFHKFTESGYNLQLIPEEPSQRRAEGLFAIKHIPSNLYYMLLAGPQPVLDEKHELKSPFITFDAYGLSIFFLSPILFLLIFAYPKKQLNKIAELTALTLALPIITYYGIGQRQVGFRYALDFFPFLFLILADAIKKVDTKILYPLVIFGIFFSIYFSFLYLFGFQVN